MKTLDDNGRLLDAEFDLERHEGGASIVFHARYGTRGSGREVNIDYLRAVEVVLARLSMQDAVITAIEVDSRVARGLPPEQRLLPLAYPLRLGKGMDVGRLRRDITEAQRQIARVSTAKPAGGNNHKRIRVSVMFPLGTELDIVRHALSGTRAASTIQPVQPHPQRPSTAGFFAPYRRAVANPSVTPATVFSIEADSLERALAGHASVQNALADFIRAYGFTPVSPGGCSPDFDVGWHGTRFTVAEIKSLNGANTDRQLRIGLGQLLQYRTQLSSASDTADAVLAVEHAVDDTWVQVCSSVGVILSWPPDWPRLKSTLGSASDD